MQKLSKQLKEIQNNYYFCKNLDMNKFLIYSSLFLVIFIQSCKKDGSLQNNLLNATVWYQTSAEMNACYYQAFNLAKMKLFTNMQVSDNEMKKAVIVDIDETMLDNSPFEAYLIKNKLEYSKKLWIEWVKLEKAKALPGALDFAKFAKENGVEIFYISNRHKENLLPTMENLKKEGFPFADTNHILLKDTTSDKTLRRNIVEQNYDVILFIGDNLRDFDENYKYDKKHSVKEKIQLDKELFGTKYIIIPNPMYGEWTKKYEGKTLNEVSQKMIENLQSY